MARDQRQVLTNASGILVADLDVSLFETTGNVVFDKVIGITKGASINEELELAETEADGAPGKMKGDTTILKVMPTLTGTFISVNKDLLDQYANNTALATASNEHYKAQTDLGLITSDQYKGNVAFITKRKDDKKIAFVLLNAINMIGIATDLNYGEDSEFEVEYTGSFESNEFRDLESSDKSPLIKFVPKDDVLVAATGVINSIDPLSIAGTEADIDVTITDADGSLVTNVRVDVFTVAAPTIVVATTTMSVSAGNEIVNITGLIDATDYIVKIFGTYNLNDGNGIQLNVEFDDDTFTTTT